MRDRLLGLVVKASASRAEDPRFKSSLHWDFFRVKSYQWLKNWHSSGYPARRLALFGQPGVSILWLDEAESWICNFYVSVAACKIVCADPSLRYTSMLLGSYATNKHWWGVLHGLFERDKPRLRCGPCTIFLSLSVAVIFVLLLSILFFEIQTFSSSVVGHRHSWFCRFVSCAFWTTSG